VAGRCVLKGLVERAGDAEGASIQYVGVDFGRADVFMSEEFLDRPDVVATFKEVCCKAVTEAVAGDALGNAHASSGRRDCTLHDGLVKVVAATLRGGRVVVGSGRREGPLPQPGALRRGIFPDQRVWELHVAGSCSDVAIEHDSRFVQLGAKHGYDVARDHGAAVFTSFAVSYQELAPFEVDVFDSQRARFHEPQAGAVEQSGDDPRWALHALEHTPDVVAGEYDRQSYWLLGAFEIGEPVERRIISA
jgi:hypothetical protein